MSTWIAQLDADVIVAPAACVAPGVEPATAAAAMGWPDGAWRVITDEERDALQAPTEEEQYNAERAVVAQKYEAPYSGTSGGILTLVQMMHQAALMEVPQDTDKIASISGQYQTELAAMKAEYQAIDDKYGV
jgi:hypothetical protein